ncbi:hypothetical protein [Helicobacter canis]|nr:hypothetical protein [Helicobacter canis]
MDSSTNAPLCHCEPMKSAWQSAASLVIHTQKHKKRYPTQSQE